MGQCATPQRDALLGPGSQLLHSLSYDLVICHCSTDLSIKVAVPPSVDYIHCGVQNVLPIRTMRVGICSKMLMR